LESSTTGGGEGCGITDFSSATNSFGASAGGGGDGVVAVSVEAGGGGGGGLDVVDSDSNFFGCS
jgi:hypothetical protein